MFSSFAKVLIKVAKVFNYFGTSRLRTGPGYPLQVLPSHHNSRALGLFTAIPGAGSTSFRLR
jgi:hypothetical protein